MPSKKQPPSLIELCTRRVEGIAENACITVEKLHGDYESSNCRREIKILRNYFLKNIGHLFEKVIAKISNCWTTHLFPTDRRIYVEFTLHENTHIANLPVIMGTTPMHHISTFWAEKLGAMKRITNLNMTHVDCTDEIIKAVSDNCIHLENIYVRTGTCNNIIYVTDDGLLHLTKCSELRIIRDISRFSTITATTIKALIVGLPRLIAINYIRIGEVLSSGFENMKLPLRIIEEGNGDAVNIDAIAKVCPNLERLSLYKDVLNPDVILYSLALSDLKVDTLELTNFVPFYVTTLLIEKGIYLRTLNITSLSANKTNEYITVIGLNCPLLENLKWLDELDGANLPIDHHYNMSEREKQKIFINLETLILRIQSSDFNSGIPQLCLRNATQIKDIHFIVLNPSDTNTDIHGIFSEILLKNTMSHLKHLEMYGSFFYLSSSTAAFELILNCLNNLEVLRVSKVKPDVAEYFKLMKSTILENNINLKLIWEGNVDDEEDYDEEDDDEEDDDDEDYDWVDDDWEDDDWQDDDEEDDDWEDDDGEVSENEDL